MTDIISKKQWKLSKSTDGLLFFAKIFVEMLRDDTLDSYKTPSLNLHSSILEFRVLSERFKEGLIKKGSLSFSLQELSERLKKDIIMSKHDKERYKKYVDDASNIISKKDITQDDKSDLCRKIAALHVDFDDKYWKNLKHELCKEVILNKSKKSILNLTAEFSTEIEFLGYSRRYALNKAKKYFFSGVAKPSLIDSASLIKSFVETFESKSKNWTVIFHGTADNEPLTRASLKEAKIFGITAQKKITIQRPIPQKVEQLITTAQNSIFFTIKDIKTKDPHSARDLASRHLDFFADVCRFHNHKTSLDYDRKGIVIDTEIQKHFVIDQATKPMECGLNFVNAETNEHFGTTLDILSGEHFVNSSIYRFRKVLDFHHAAMQSSSMENQLLDLWAALEGFLPKPPKDDDRIVHFLKCLLPVLTLTYNDKIFKNLSTDLYAIPAARTHIEESPIEGNFFEKTTYLATCCEMQEWREILLSMLNCNPELRYRLHNISTDYSNSRKIHKHISKHRTKVELHIQRIYTVRNQIVHNAETMPYLRSIIENLHDYLDTTTLSIAKVGKFSKQKVGIDTCFEIIQSIENQHLSYLNGASTPTTTLTCFNNIFGISNIISAFSVEPNDQE